MPSGLWMLLPGLLCSVLPLGSGRRPGTGAAAPSVSRARCTSRCLALHIAHLSASFKSLQNDEILIWCEGHRRCAQKHHECLTSCEFLKSIQTVKQGDCPAPQKASGFEAACVQSCNSDTECPSSRKCCSNGCGQTCQAPTNMFKGVPLKPRKELGFAEDKNGNLAVAWMSKFNVSMEPVFYILQRRWNSGMYPSEDDASKWETVAYTTEEHVNLKNVRPNIWYQFRVAAVNIHGTRGFTTPSKHFHSSRDPSPPGAPRNLWKGNFTARNNGVFSLIIHWDPPQEEDLFIHHYRIYWSQWVSRKTVFLTKKENWKIIEGSLPYLPVVEGLKHTSKHCMHLLQGHPGMDETTEERQAARRTTNTDHVQPGSVDGHLGQAQVKDEVEIEGLQPNTEYLVQMQAVANWGQKRLKSSKALFFFNTPSIDIQSNHASTTDEVSNELPSIDEMFDIRSLEAAVPYFHGNQLQVKVHWKKAEEENLKDQDIYLLTWIPESCAKYNSQIQQHATVKGTHFVITGLLFACEYKVTVQPIVLQGQTRQAVTYVTTPHCSSSIKVKVLKRLLCARNGLRQTSSPASGKVILKAEKLTAAFVAENGSMTGEFHWQVSLSQPHQLITGYQLNWTEISTVNRPVVISDMVISQAQVLPPDQPFMTILNLRPLTTYRIEVRILSTTGKGPATVKTFQTPQVYTAAS
ncbi:anosmin-1b isoform X2 [Heterodontus francisci]|uniref:anosmin-1b isoform X2 n=1 Tax=Heterodontus francisci TaxID=7792 RepID=UPI00355B2B8E